MEIDGTRVEHSHSLGFESLVDPEVFRREYLDALEYSPFDDIEALLGDSFPFVGRRLDEMGLGRLRVPILKLSDPTPAQR